jgi:peptidoglycan/LPS O-acetylase OafA/YrhL
LKNENRLLELDALRGLAAIGVLLFHYTLHYFAVFKINNPLIFKMKYGYLGVQLFFIISGFVIFMTLNKVKKPFDFIVSRFSRIYPAYWFCLILTFVTLYFFYVPGRVTSFKDALVNLSMLQMFFKVPNVDGVYWSLRIELLFYFWMLLIYIRGILKKIEWIGLLWMVLMIFAYYIELPKYVRILKILLVLDFGHLFLAGILFYRIKNEGFTVLSGALLLLTYVVQCITGDIESTYAVTVFYITFILFSFNKLSIIKFKPLLFLGAISYPLYLIHQYVGYILIKMFTNLSINTTLSIFLTLSLVIVLASAIHFFVEKPSNEYIRNYYKNYKTKIEKNN